MTVKTIYAAECGFVPDLKADQSAVLQAIFDGIEYAKDLKDRYSVLWLYYMFCGQERWT